MKAYAFTDEKDGSTSIFKTPRAGFTPKRNRWVHLVKTAKSIDKISKGFYEASEITFKESRSLGDVSTWEWLESIGVSFSVKSKSAFGNDNSYESGEVALECACWNGYTDVVKFLISRGPKAIVLIQLLNLDS